MSRCPPLVFGGNLTVRRELGEGCEDHKAWIPIRSPFRLVGDPATSDALVLDESGMTFPVTFPAVFLEWRWCAATDLPDLEQGRRRDASGGEVYRQMLEGQAARLTLGTLAEAFGFLRQVLEPSSLKKHSCVPRRHKRVETRSRLPVSRRRPALRSDAWPAKARPSPSRPYREPA